MIDTVIFDMDGVIIDSEPFWRKADIITYASVGLELTDDMCRQTTGLGSDESVAFWYHYKPWANKSFEKIKEEVFNNVMDQIEEQGTLNAGVISLLNFFEGKGMKIGLASSSPIKIIQLVVNKLDLKHRFQVLCSADQVRFGKPHPAVYLAALDELESNGVSSLAIEDSFNGLISAKAARMKTLAVLESRYFPETRFDFADLKLRSLEEFTKAHFDSLNQ
jgi:sugar-phosphatase